MVTYMHNLALVHPLHDLGARLLQQQQ